VADADMLDHIVALVERKAAEIEAAEAAAAQQLPAEAAE
jgi:(E)-4-hydroxy-3-methylbut-2-enyl-diphosphate synthase